MSARVPRRGAGEEDGFLRLEVRDEADVFAARRCARELALAEGLPETAAWRVAIAVSEIAWNVVVHAGRGEVLVGVVSEGGRRGVRVVARDRAGGIVVGALREGHSTAGGLGLGIPVARRLVDLFEILSRPGEGTTVTMTKWLDGPVE